MGLLVARLSAMFGLQLLFTNPPPLPSFSYRLTARPCMSPLPELAASSPCCLIGTLSVHQSGVNCMAIAPLSSGAQQTEQRDIPPLAPVSCDLVLVAGGDDQALSVSVIRVGREMVRLSR